MLEHGPEMTRRAVISPLSRTHSLATDLGYKKPTIASSDRPQDASITGRSTHSADAVLLAAAAVAMEVSPSVRTASGQQNPLRVRQHALKAAS